MLDQYRTQDEIDPTEIKTWFESAYGDADYQDVFGQNSDYDNGRTVRFVYFLFLYSLFAHYLLSIPKIFHIGRFWVF